MHITNTELEKLVNQLGYKGYKGCKNCENQISPLKMCEWAEQGGDGAIHFICPKWRKKGVSE